MNKKRVAQLACLAAIGLSLAACEQQDVSPAKASIAASSVNGEAETTSTEDRNQLARLLAVELGSNEKLRDFLREEALSQFDGDYDVLYQRVADRRIGDETLEDIFTRQFVRQAENRGQSVSGDEARSWVQRTIAGIPLCQFSVPVNCEKWENSYAPLVIALPTDFDDMKVESILSFNQDGKEEVLDGAVEPEQPVVVIGSNERVNEKGEVEAGYTTANRNNGAMERLERYKIRDINAIEHWLLGGPELQMQYWVAPMPNYSTYPYQPASPPYQLGTWSQNPSRNSVKNGQWINSQSLLYYWYLNSYGQTFRDIWVERDAGPNIRLNLSVTLPKGVVITFNPTIGSNDERMGEQFVNYNDPHWPQNQQNAYGPGEVYYFRGSY
ncbi:hypothetical protein [Hymenobacter rubripertinctus]|uniref:DUF3103 family protein n=1 Tax=Hymenobacter rubripertinctus TaxID=2029981 RepID=A0A418R1T0_9BACT|nr:hypothetical protein [Hymenobacter rubripertinctus]RIY11382.1 hypothetical protein D0T11_07940 [Hymenobacter rubripertinctus]